MYKYTKHKSVPIGIHNLSDKLNVTGPAKVGHVGTNYTLAHNISYFFTGIEYVQSVTVILTPTQCFISAENFIATQQWNTKL